MRVTIPVANGFYVSDSLPLSYQRCMNWRPNVPQTSSVTDANLFPTEGITTIIQGSSAEECRGAHVMAGVSYFVISRTLYSLSRSELDGVPQYSLNPLGLIEGNKRVFMADNGVQLCIVAVPDAETLGKSYIYDGALQEITSPNFDGPAASVVYANGYFVFHKSDGKKGFHSNLLDGLTYDAGDSFTADSDPDQIRGLEVLGGVLYVFGSETTQKFKDVARTPSTFAPVPGGVLDIGLSSSQSLVKAGSGIAFIGAAVNQTPSAWLILSGQVQKISTTSIDNELAKRDLFDDKIFCWAYSDSGSNYFGISLLDTCFVYDFSNRRWHERSSVDVGGLSAYRPTNFVTSDSELYVGDRQSGSIGIIDKEVYTEFETIVPRLMTTQAFENQGEPVNISSIEAVIDAGKGLGNDISIKTGKSITGRDVFGLGGSEPNISLSWSDTYAANFSDPVPRSMGKIGETTKRPIWWRQGRVDRARIMRLECSTPTKAVLIKVEAEIA